MQQCVCGTKRKIEKDCVREKIEKKKKVTAKFEYVVSLTISL
jgi:hypothetical protein